MRSASVSVPWIGPAEAVVDDVAGKLARSVDAPFRERPAFAKDGRERCGPLAQVQRPADEPSSLLRDGYARIDA